MNTYLDALKAQNPGMDRYSDEEILSVLPSINPAFADMSPDEIKHFATTPGASSLTDIAVSGYDRTMGSRDINTAAKELTQLNDPEFASVTSVKPDNSSFLGTSADELRRRSIAANGGEEQLIEEAQTKLDRGNARLAEADKVNLSATTQKFLTGEGDTNWLEDFLADPVTIVAEIGAQSAYGSLEAVGTGLLLAPAGPAGLATGTGMGSGRVEFAHTVAEELRKSGIDTTNAKAMRKALAEQPGLYRSATEKAMVRAGIIGAADAATMGIASKTLGVGNGLLKHATNLGAQSVVQMGGGAAGEAGAQLATEGEVSDPRAVAAEAVGELVTAPVDVYAATRDYMGAANERIQKAGEDAAAAGGDALDQTIAKAHAATNEIPRAVAEEKAQKAAAERERIDWSQYDKPTAQRFTAEREQQGEIDTLISIARKEGFAEDEVRLQNAKRLFTQADQARANGDNVAASRFAERGNQIVRDIAEPVIAERVNQFPATYSFAGEVQGGELSTSVQPQHQSVTIDGELSPEQVGADQAQRIGVKQPDNLLTDQNIIYGEEPEYTREAREQREADHFNAMYGRTGSARIAPVEGELLPPGLVTDESHLLENHRQPQQRLESNPMQQLPPGENTIYGEQERPERSFEPVDPIYDGVGRNIAERQAPTTAALPNKPTISQQQFIDLQKRFRDVATTPLSKRTEGDKQVVQQFQAVKRGEIVVSEEAPNIEIEAPNAAAVAPNIKPSAKRYNRDPDPEHDDLLSAIALGGGIRRDFAEAVDPADYSRRAAGIRYVFPKSKGRSLDDMAEYLRQFGYVQTVEDLQAKLDQALRGETVLTPEGQMRRADMEAEEEARMAEEREPLAEGTTSDEAWIAVAVTEAREAGVPEETIHSILDTETNAVLAAVELRNEIDTAKRAALQEGPGAEGSSSTAETEFPEGELTTAESVWGSDEDLLTSYSESDLQAREAKEQAARDQQAKEEQQAEQKRQADAELNDFTLSGSDRPADVAASRGQNDMFGAGSNSNSPAQEAEPSSLKRRNGKITYTGYSGQSREVGSYWELDGYRVAKVHDGLYEVINADGQAVGQMAGLGGAERAIRSGKYLKEKVADANQPQGFESDIPYQLAYDAYRGISHVPEDRAKQTIASYANYMQNTYNTLQKMVRNHEEQKLLDTEFNRFRQNHRTKYHAYLSAKSKTLSSMITGPARFNVSRNQKALSSEDKRWEEVAALQDKAIKAIKKQLRPELAPIKTGEAGALEKLKTKLAQAEQAQEMMKHANRVVRSKKDVTRRLVDEVGLTEAQAKEIQKPDFAGRTGFADYALKNNNAEIRRLRGRIQEEERRAKQAEAASDSETEFAFDGGTVEVDYDDNRIRISHDSKPDEEVRDQLKKSGWRWSRKSGAWQRQLTNNAIYSAESITGASIETPVFSRAGSGDSNNAPVLSVDAVRVATERIAKRLRIRGVKLSVVETEDLLPASLKAQIAADGAEGQIKAAYHGKVIHIVSDRMNSVTDVEEAILHEGAHYGGRALFGKEMHTAYRKLWMRLGGVKGLRARAKETGFNMDHYIKTADDLIAKGEISAGDRARFLVDEFLAHLNQQQVHEKLPARIMRALQEFLGSIRNALRKAKFAELPKLTDADLAYLLRKINKATQGEIESDKPHFMRATKEDEMNFFFEDLAAEFDAPAMQRSEEAPMFSRTADNFDDLNEQQEAFLDKIGPEGPLKTLKHRIDELLDNWRLKVRQAVVDRYAPLFSIDKQAQGEDVIETNIQDSAWVLARMASSADGALNAMLNHGRIQLDEGVIDIRENSKGLIDTLKQLGDSAEIERFMGWIAANRADKLMKQGRENLFTEEEIAAGILLNEGKTANGLGRAELYNQVFEEFQQYRDDVLTIADKAGLLRKGMEDDEALIVLARQNGIREDLVKKVLTFSRAMEAAQDPDELDQAQAKHARFVAELRDSVATVLDDFDQQFEMLTTDQRELWANEFYVPFYRVFEDMDVKGPVATGGLSRQEAYKKLKGGNQNLNGLLGNTLMNFNHLITSSLKNMAAQKALENAEAIGAAEVTSESARNKKQSTFVLKDGVKHWYNVDDVLVYRSLISLGDSVIKFPGMGLMRSFKRVFTNFTTASPQFIAANFIRDTLQAAATSEVSGNVAKNAYQGMKAYGVFSKQSRTRAKMLASGGAFSFGHVYGEDADTIKIAIDGELRRAHVLKNPASAFNLLRAAWDKYHDVSDSFENVNRAAIYEQNQDKGKLYAAFKARDLMDFSQRGVNPVVTFLIDTVPFLNARIQGLDKLYRAGAKPTARVLKGKGTEADRAAAARFAAVTGALTMATIALYLHNRDDEDYRALEDWQKDTYWFFKVGDEKFFIPKPFEVGAIATLAERSVEQMVDDQADAELFLERLGHMVSDTFSFNPVPQIVRPLVDVKANEDSFTGRPIESMGMERLSPSLRAHSGTSDPAKWISAGLENTVGAVLGKDSSMVASPVQVDYMIRQYLGWVGERAIATVDTVSKKAKGVEEPHKDWYEYQPFRRFYQSSDAPAYTRYQTEFYEDLKEVNRLYADVRKLQELGQHADAQELRQENWNKLRYRKFLNQKQRQLSAISKKMKMIERSDLPAEIKRKRLDVLKLRRNALVKMVSDRVN